MKPMEIHPLDDHPTALANRIKADLIADELRVIVPLRPDPEERTFSSLAETEP